MARRLKILHTSDIHIGRKLKDRDRTKEFKEFFVWLEEQIINEGIDMFLISGDIFDNTTPSVQAQEIYYSFLGHIAESECRHIIIISGNHDSALFIDAPSEVLKHCKVHVIGQACENPEDEVIPLKNSDGHEEAIVCAVPYLRDKDVRTASIDDSFRDIDRALQAGIKSHYERVFNHARKLQGDSNIPIIAMGHLFLKNGRTSEGDGVRSLYVGTSIQVGSEIFPEDITYTALGHLHSPQYIGRENIRYSGSPIAMGFGEAGQDKSVILIETDGRNIAEMKEIHVPVFQRLERISGDMKQIENGIKLLGTQNESIWLEVTHTGRPEINLQERLNDCVKNYSSIEILSVYDESIPDELKLTHVNDDLEKISPVDMLNLLLDGKNIPEEQRKILIPLYQEILRDLGVDF